MRAVASVLDLWPSALPGCGLLVACAGQPAAPPPAPEPAPPPAASPAPPAAAPSASVTPIPTPAPTSAPDPAPSAPEPPEPPPAPECQRDSDCKPAGCSGEICAAQPLGSACGYAPHFACFKQPFARCACTSGQCGWKQNPALDACIAKARGAP